LQCATRHHVDVAATLDAANHVRNCTGNKSKTNVYQRRQGTWKYQAGAGRT
jgi:hypothetical protein